MSLVDTAVVGAQSSVELAALGPGTSVCDNLAYMCGFLAQAWLILLLRSLYLRGLGMIAILGDVTKRLKLVVIASRFGRVAMAGDVKRDRRYCTCFSLWHGCCA